MGAVAHKVEHHVEVQVHDRRQPEPSGLPSQPQVMDLLAFLALPASAAMSFATCVLVMWSMNGGGETAWAIWAGLMSVFGVGSVALIAASLADQR